MPSVLSSTRSIAANSRSALKIVQILHNVFYYQKPFAPSRLTPDRIKPGSRHSVRRAPQAALAIRGGEGGAGEQGLRRADSCKRGASRDNTNA